MTITEEPPKTDGDGFTTNPVGVTVNSAVAKFAPSLMLNVFTPDNGLVTEYSTVLLAPD